MCRKYSFALMGLLAVSCSVTTAPVPVTPTETPRTEVIIASTFTPEPLERLQMPDAQQEYTATAELTPPITSSNPEDAPHGSLDTYTKYTVTAGDTLINIALHYEVPMAAIQLENDMGDTTVVRVNQILEIPESVGWEDASPFWIVYLVQAGESISKIAAKYALSVTEVVQANDFTEADLITVGQPIVLPLNGPAQVAAVAQAPFPTPTKPAETLPPPTTEPTLALTDAPTQVPPTPVPVAQPQPHQEFAGDTAAMRLEILRLINEQRAIYGLAPLVWNDILADAAQKHANDCYERGWCGHTGSDGSNMKTRIVREGYDPVRWSECWAWYATPSQAVEMWMDEAPPNDPHRRTILSTSLTEVGVGVTPGNGYGYYYIVDFGTPRQ